MYMAASAVEMPKYFTSRHKGRRIIRTRRNMRRARLRGLGRGIYTTVGCWLRCLRACFSSVKEGILVLFRKADGSEEQSEQTMMNKREGR